MPEVRISFLPHICIKTVNIDVQPEQTIRELKLKLYEKLVDASASRTVISELPIIRLELMQLIHTVGGEEVYLNAESQTIAEYSIEADSEIRAENRECAGSGHRECGRTCIRRYYCIQRVEATPCVIPCFLSIV